MPTSRNLLDDLRKEIDTIDFAIIDLLAAQKFSDDGSVFTELGFDDVWVDQLLRLLSTFSGPTWHNNQELAGLLSQRFEAVRQVGEYKKEKNLPPLQPARWQEVVTTRKQYAGAQWLDPDLIGALWDLFHDYALVLEERVIQDVGEAVKACVP